MVEYDVEDLYPPHKSHDEPKSRSRSRSLDKGLLLVIALFVIAGLVGVYFLEPSWISKAGIYLAPTIHYISGLFKFVHL